MYSVDNINFRMALMLSAVGAFSAHVIRHSFEHRWNSFELNMLLMNCIKWLSRNSSSIFA